MTSNASGGILLLTFEQPAHRRRHRSVEVIDRRLISDLRQFTGHFIVTPLDFVPLGHDPLKRAVVGFTNLLKGFDLSLCFDP